MQNSFSYSCHNIKESIKCMMDDAEFCRLQCSFIVCYM